MPRLQLHLLLPANVVYEYCTTRTCNGAGAPVYSTRCLLRSCGSTRARCTCRRHMWWAASCRTSGSCVSRAASRPAHTSASRACRRERCASCQAARALSSAGVAPAARTTGARTCCRRWSCRSHTTWSACAPTGTTSTRRAGCYAPVARGERTPVSGTLAGASCVQCKLATRAGSNT